MKPDERALLITGVLLVLLELVVIFGSLYFVVRSINHGCPAGVAKCIGRETARLQKEFDAGAAEAK